MIALKTNRAHHIRGDVLHAGDSCAIVVLEANLKDPPAYAGGVLDELLKTAVETGIDEPATLADRVGAILREDARYRSIGAVFFAAGRIEGDHVDVCTAGDIRVHLVDLDTNAVQMTRDHNAVSDAEDGEYSYLLDPPAGFLENTPTRALPPSGKPPEALRWSRPRNGLLCVCSSRVHLYRHPSAYLNSLVAEDSGAGVPELGFAATVRWP